MGLLRKLVRVLNSNFAENTSDEMRGSELINRVNRMQARKPGVLKNKNVGSASPAAEYSSANSKGETKPFLLRDSLGENGRRVFPEPYEGKMFLGKAKQTPFPKPGILPSKKERKVCKLSPAHIQIIEDRGKPQEALSEIAEGIIKCLHIKKIDSKPYYYKDIIWKPLDSKQTLRKVSYDFVSVHRSLGDGQWGEIYKIILSKIDEYPVLELNDPGVHHMVCFNNCVYDVMNDEMLPHSYKYPLDTCINFEFEPREKTYSRVFNDYLDTSSQGNEHVKKRMLQFMGACCSNLPPLKKIGLVMGEPNSGKSTYGNIIKTIVGPMNTASFSFENLTRFSNYSFVGKMLGLSTDMSDKRVSKTAASWLKMMTGGDTVFADVKHGEGFSYVSKCRFIIASNYYPDFADKALEDRMLVIPLPKSLKENDINRNLLNDIKNDMQAVLRQIMDELREFIISGYEFEDIGALEFYKPNYYSNSDTQASSFFHSRCYYEEGSKLARDEIYAAFCFFCEEKGMRAISKETFEKQFKPITKEYGIRDDTNGSNGRRYKNLAISDVDDPNAPRAWN